jgi:hypothetical protein
MHQCIRPGEAEMVVFTSTFRPVRIYLPSIPITDRLFDQLELGELQEALLAWL